jgi:membrane protein
MWQSITFWFRVLMRSLSHWLEGNAFVFAAALAFFTVFSIAPVMIIAVTIVGLVLGGEAAEGRIVAQLEETIGTQAAEAVQTAVASSQIDQTGLLPTMLGVGAMIFGATTVFAQMQLSLNAIWGVAPKPSRNSIFLFIMSRVLSLTVVLVIGFIMLVSLLLTVGLRALTVFAADWLWIPGFILVGLESLIGLAVAAALFAAIFRVLPDVQLSWRDVIPGAIVTALLFSVGRIGIAFYLANTATASTYGAAGSLALLLLWVNYSALILLFGAAFTRAHTEARGIRIRPRPTAVSVHRELIEDVPITQDDDLPPSSGEDPSSPRST